MYFFFDTETTGKPRSYRAAVEEVDNWPRVVQIAWEVYDKRGKQTVAECYIIRPAGFTIPEDVVRIHGITQAHAIRNGVRIESVLEEFREAVTESSHVVAHNLEFDMNVIGAELYRLGIKNAFRHKMQFCTMTSSTDYCQLPGPHGYKWPKLGELHEKLFRKTVKETHNAGDDVATCAKCFFELKRLGII